MFKKNWENIPYPPLYSIFNFKLCPIWLLLLIVIIYKPGQKSWEGRGFLGGGDKKIIFIFVNISEFGQKRLNNF